jgi:hypothetical protein
MDRSETINTSYWQSLGWELMPFNVPGIVIEVDPPDPYSNTQEWVPYGTAELTMSELRARLHERRSVVPDIPPADVIRELRDEP